MPEDAPSARYERYSIVAFADAVTTALVDALRAAIPPRIPVMPPHVTVRGSFVEPVSLAAVWAAIEEESAATAPMSVEVERLQVGETSVGLRLRPHPRLQSLHDRLYHRLATQVTDVYGDAPGAGYRPHMTAMYGLDAAAKAQLAPLLSDLEGLGAIELESVSLVGRGGSAQSGRWVTIGTAPMSGRT